jgi:hypothetical protein
MAEIKKARAQDFESIHRLLLDFNNPSIAKEDWHRTFVNPWDQAEDYFGHILVEAGEVAGFFGLIFSRRVIRHREEKFCNLSSWIVKPSHRQKSLALLYPVLDLEDYTLTDYSATPSACELMTRFDFQPLDRSFVVLPLWRPALFGHRPGAKARALFDPAMIAANLPEPALKIHRDHLPFYCRQVLLVSDLGCCHLVLTKFGRKRKPCAHIHHISNVEVFLDAFDRVKIALMLHLKVLFLRVDERLLKGHQPKRARLQPMPVPRLFRSSTLAPEDIDSLYSELVTMKV